ncbi:aminotransferase class I/II-fold pyridoxal phosphate-dependent enzyme [Clostridium sp. CM028]|uniref:aminotransferase class I/II-fold pyridoxal phosphate-dependent enzyme n=1 Tax=unclassified Clostridium TaxID=2614128 RepID=UPI001C0CC614|nr:MULTISPECIES: aminotransferase class I/II-fold pyridoxal phosphate-dependent enzyme [unclassified Clostridium]MBU3093809.1 aminotransferase class I/II-fold pyridoxal phosphate-dependent enzyme [Clostridium sp. CF011]MBW9149993.1 aminotransferase class I/II-fold pyridoxal phosphate-dependent enzyme [Clostridium sp. CM028]WAG68833.1 aminotransferase class I/II-fold pyridoxal phosphate-dependent enzyme [Clostridium sp. CF011]WLC60607.1 aminotransferase class I/II-fold pyridoxal phosphate-depend
MSRLPLVDGVLKYIKEKNVSFCMPGHKGGLGFFKTIRGKELYENFIKGDITEVDGLDNLHHAEGIIKESQELLSEYYGSIKSYFLVNGSTSGNLAMIFSSFNEGDKIIVERNCHRSIFNAIIMRKLKPVYIKNEIHPKYDVPFPLDKEHFSTLINENKDAKGIIVTYPNYYGICFDLSYITQIARKYNIKVLVDAAHGAHFGANKLLPENPLKMGVNMVVMSAHKTLPSLTQTAFLHVGKGTDISKVDFYASAFLSTSPSYMLLCSMDYARFYLQECGENDYEELIKICKFNRERINRLGKFHIIGEEDLLVVSENSTKYDNKYTMDLTRYILNVPKGYSGHKLLEYLRINNIQAEMSDSRNVVLIFSPFNNQQDFEVLYIALKNCDMNNLKGKYVELIDYGMPMPIMYPYEVMDREKTMVELKNSQGKISAVAIVPYPPGIPIVMPGERLDEDTIAVIEYYLQCNVTVLGINDGKVATVEK